MRPGQAGPEIRLFGADRLLAARPVAAMGNAPALAATLADLYEVAWEASPTLRRAGAERMLASGFEELFNHLDPYSRYVSPEEAQRARERRVGQSGLGLRISAQGASQGAGQRTAQGPRDGEGLAVVSVTPGGPAEEADIRRGDRLVAVDGRPVSARDPGAAAALLEGPEGSEVRLTLLRGGRRRQVVLVRLVLPPETVEAERRFGILWVRLSGFAAATDRDLAVALGNAFAAGLPSPQGVVLDLRGNRGGLLGQAVAVADAFLAGGEVARTEGRHPEAARSHEAGGQDLAMGRPVVVLVDGRTASAAEIVAAGLAERGRAVVVGSATQGKGLVQLVAPLPHGGELLVSWSRVLAPSGWPIQGLGVLPALCSSLGPDELARGFVALQAGEAPMARILARQRALRPPAPAAEVAALRDACPAAEGRQADLEVARRLIESPAAYEAARR
jgi:carboxyl-terminal processing protease